MLDQEPASAQFLAQILRKPAPPPPLSVFRVCGTSILPGRSYCVSCAITPAREALIEAARRGRVAAQSRDAQARRAETQRKHARAKVAWQQSSQPGWLSSETYSKKIQPRLGHVSISTLSSALSISRGYAVAIRAGRRQPHPRHWANLARLVDIAPDKLK